MNQRRFGIDAFTLKLIAVIAMTVDHVGHVFFPGVIWMRVIGRLTMPIMAFFIAEGYHHTRDVKRYALRLLIAALVSAVPFTLAFGHASLGVMWTLLMGLVALWAIDNLPNRFWQTLVVLLCCLASLVGDWQLYGVGMVVAFGVFRGRFGAQALSLSALLLVAFIEMQLPGPVSLSFIWSAAGVLALPLLYFYNGKRGRDMRYGFYAYYPLHLAVIALVAALMR